VIGTSVKGWASVALAALAAFIAPATASAFDPAQEAQNFAKTEERNQHIVLTPEFQARLTEQNLADIGQPELIIANDPERNFLANICFNRKQECAGDVRFYDWGPDGFGVVEPVLFTGRSGATLSGNVWRTEAGPAKRPLIVITTGSVQAPETLYWGFAATLAKHGYVVLTYDVQGQGRSDTFGEAPDDNEGVPSQSGQPFYDGTEDALDFALSTATEPYDPRPSCGNANGGTGTDHSAKQDSRVADGLNAAYNPFYEYVDPDRVGIAGHSLGAGAVSYIGQIDPRVDAIVAWDNLRAPSSHPDCPSGSAPRPDDPPITKPAIGMSNDYGLAATPNMSDPDPEGANGGFTDYKDAGIDSMQVNTRGGTHFEYSFIPGMTVHPLGLASLRGPDMAIWNTTAWFDKYIKCADGSACETAADAQLLTDRWRSDPISAQVDPQGDANLYSFYKRSRFDFHTAAGTEVTCDDMRTGCVTMTPDALPVPYSHVADAFQPDTGQPPGGDACALPQAGTDGDDTPRTLPPSDAGDALRGQRGSDRLRGGDGDDCLYGGKGRDRLKGDAGDDVLSGGGRNDRLVGGSGADELKCGQGRYDVAKADADDTVAASCEIVKGI
jgi:dienelactone hydrolase